MNGVFQVLGSAIYSYGGEIDQYRGDGLVAFFGATAAHEDDPERAVLAALAMQEAIVRYAQELAEEQGIELALRVGVNTGEVIAASVGDSRQHREDTAMGRAIALAARMETACEPGTVLVSEHTYRLTEPSFEWEVLGEIAVKGYSEPVAVHRPLAAKAHPGKGRGIPGLVSPLVGRDHEFGALREALERLRAGVGGIVTLVGEAGIGKSRLVAELRKPVPSADEGSSLPSSGDLRSDLRWLEGRCLSYATGVAYYLWLDLLRGWLGVAPDAPPVAVREALRELVQALCPDRPDDVYPYLGRLLSLSLEDNAEAKVRGLDGESLQFLTFRAVETLLVSAATQGPLLVVCEDLHWADPTSLALLQRLLSTTERASLLLLCVFRPLREHGCWQIRELAARDYPHCHTDLRLEPLSSTESAALVGNLLHVEDLPGNLRARILARAEGNPFFVEEILRSLLDADAIARDADTGLWRAARDVADIPIPDTVHGVITARIDRLPEEARRVLQQASVLGRIFRYPVLAAVVRSPQLPEEERARGDLDAQLIALQRAQLIRERARLPEREYAFKHALTQEAAYGGLLRRERRLTHRRAAEALERLYPERLEEQFGLLAHHWEQAGETEQAVDYFYRAGVQAAAQYANQEAIAHLSRGIELLMTTPQTPERARRELDLQIALGVSLVHTKGHAAREVKVTYARAQALCEQVGDDPQRFQVLLGLRRFYSVRGKLQTAHTLGKQLLATAQRLQDPTYLSRAHMMQGEALYNLGEFARAREHTEQGLVFYDPTQRRSHTFLYGNDTGIGCRIIYAHALWPLGYPDEALAMSQEALDQARALAHPFTLVFALYFKALLHRLRREVSLAREDADSVLRISRERGFALYLAWGTILRAWALAQVPPERRMGSVVKEQLEEGLNQMREGIAAWRAVGSAVMLPGSLAALAQACGQVGKVGEAVGLLDEALRLVDENGERCWEAELHRLRGELLLLRGEREAKVEACFQRALDVARRQGARSWELRAATSLGRLWQRQNRKQEARALLQAIYGWFSEGFETADLEEARGLLDALA